MPGVVEPPPETIVKEVERAAFRQLEGSVDSKGGGESHMSAGAIADGAMSKAAKLLGDAVHEGRLSYAQEGKQFDLIRQEIIENAHDLVAKKRREEPETSEGQDDRTNPNRRVAEDTRRALDERREADQRARKTAERKRQNGWL